MKVEEERIFASEAVTVPGELGRIVREYTKAVLREAPKDVLGFSARYFENLVNRQEGPATSEASDALPKED